VLNEAWETSESSDVNVEGKKIETGESKNDNKENLGSMSIQYTEPSFLPFTQLPGISHAAKVFIKEGISGDANGKSISNTKMMAIDPYDFGQVAWFRKDLLPYHINEYLNLLSGEPSSCLVSKSFSETYKVKPGDYISVGWDSLDKAVLNVYGVIDYWPSWNPEKDPDSLQKGYPNLIVANLPYIQDHLSMEPYSIWLKMKPDATSQQVYEAIKKENIPVLSLRDSRQEILKLRSSDPFQLTINGLMTMGFLISGVICLIGFLIYWVITLGSRTLQFGIFRAMGISVKQLIRMMACEQFFTSGVSMGAGILIGGLTSRIFAQLFQISYNAELQVPPFKVVSYISDRLKVYLLIAIIMIFGLLILIYLLSRIKIHQAIKLGED
jgi:putative ABC transport system permease protein